MLNPENFSHPPQSAIESNDQDNTHERTTESAKKGTKNPTKTKKNATKKRTIFTDPSVLFSMND